jgi:Lon protease-like protein
MHHTHRHEVKLIKEYSRVLQSSRLFGMIGVEKEGADGVTLCRVGCILRIVQCEMLPDGRSLIHTRGYQRFTVKEHWVEVCLSLIYRRYIIITYD